ncbi:CoA ester lyase [Aquamicrobium sp. LC103]|uniref:HpcH/HpaI aldolase/citrate lyase family protein n=1 Tax=Aquamicrobium sp. LC103 TaxID=1120658 RepID=UPI00063E93A6|nr:CoA ester lyase [Aquamicrobium sp. LC103]TKT76806.1 CoA ester lyase [Aquamicrobium sp. LC103]
MRSLLFVPGDSEKKLAKGLESGADILIIDLEDSVSADRKAAGRGIAADFIRANAGGTGPLLYVRVNDLSTGVTDDDLAAVMPAAPTGIMLPKANHADDVARLSVRLRVHEAEYGLADGATRIIPIITETPHGVLNASSYRPGEQRIAGLTWGAEDLSAEIGAQETRDEAGSYTDVFRFARTVTILAAAGAEVAAIDTVFPNFRDMDAFSRDSLQGVRDGFTARMAIHPAQVPVINEIFTPSTGAIELAQAIVDAFDAAGNPGVVGIEGKMYDRPHLKRAQRLLARAGKGR